MARRINNTELDFDFSELLSEPEQYVSPEQSWEEIFTPLEHLFFARNVRKKEAEIGNLSQAIEFFLDQNNINDPSLNLVENSQAQYYPTYAQELWALSSPEDQAYALQEWETIGQQAYEDFCANNLRLVWKMCNRFIPFLRDRDDSERSDAFATGFQGLHRAMESYDFRQGFQFSTYATPWIGHFLRRYWVKTDLGIKFTDNEFLLRGKVFKTRKDLLARQQEVTPQHILSFLQAQGDTPEITLEDVKKALLIGEPVSFDAKIGKNPDDDAFTLYEILPSEEENIEDTLTETETAAEVRTIMEQLNPQFQDLLQSLHGINNTPQMSLNEWAQLRNINPRKARKLLESAYFEFRRLAQKQDHFELR